MPPSPPNRSRTSVSDAASKRRVARSRDLFIDLFRDALNSLTSTDNEDVKAITDDEAEELATSAYRVAEAALRKIEERFPGL
jgi:hypothetical protein